MKVLETKNAPGAIGPYSQGVIAGNLVYTSGQIPVNPANGQVEDCVKCQTKQSLENVKSILESAGCTMDNVVKTTVFLKNIADFGKMNEVYKGFFSEGNYPARSAFQVAALPQDALVEIEVVALKD